MKVGFPEVVGGVFRDQVGNAVNPLVPPGRDSIATHHVHVNEVGSPVLPAVVPNSDKQEAYKLKGVEYFTQQGQGRLSVVVDPLGQLSPLSDQPIFFWAGG